MCICNQDEIANTSSAGDFKYSDDDLGILLTLNLTY